MTIFFPDAGSAALAKFEWGAGTEAAEASDSSVATSSVESRSSMAPRRLQSLGQAALARRSRKLPYSGRQPMVSENN